jgi:hypothetical protein
MPPAVRRWFDVTGGRIDDSVCDDIMAVAMPLHTADSRNRSQV